MEQRLLVIATLSICACRTAPPLPPELPPPAAIEVAVPAPPDPEPEPEPEPTPPAPDSGQSDDGISWTVLRSGNGHVHPGPNDRVRVHYTGWTTDGKKFDSSVDRGKPATFGVRKVIKGWTATLQRMVVGDKWLVVIPAHLAYGVKPKRPGAPAGDLTFEIDLLEVTRAPSVPKDVSAPPAHATITPSGLAWVALKRGVGRVHPTPTSKVTVHYSGWMTNGEMFDSSVMRGKTAKFGVGGVIKGWTEALQIMAVGDMFRLWIPPDLAYGNTPKRPGAPWGMLVFDVELIDVQP